MLLFVPESTPAAPMPALQEVLMGRLEELGVSVRFSTAPPGLPPVREGTAQPEQDVLAFIWLETLPDSIVVHFYEAAGASLRERRIPVAGLNAASIEEVAVAVRSAVSALLERVESAAEQDRRGKDTASRPAPVFAPAPRVPSPAARDEAERRRGAFRLAVGYVGQGYAPETRWNHGVAVGSAWRPWAAPWSLGASYFWFPALERRTDVVRVTLRRHPAEVTLAWELSVWDSWVLLRPEAAMAADFVVRRTTAGAQGIEATAEQGRWSWAASGRLAVVAIAMPPWQVSLAGGADYLLNRFTYTVAGDTETLVIAPRRLRPQFSADIAIELP